MKILHILRSEPDALSRRLIDGISRAGGASEVSLYGGRVDYDRLVRDIFESDRVVCWWASSGPKAEVSKR
jgi:hypothetical protein